MKKFSIGNDKNSNQSIKLPSYFQEVWREQQLTGNKILRGHYYKNSYVHPDLVADGKCNGYQLEANIS